MGWPIQGGGKCHDSISKEMSVKLINDAREEMRVKHEADMQIIIGENQSALNAMELANKSAMVAILDAIGAAIAAHTTRCIRRSPHIISGHF